MFVFITEILCRTFWGNKWRSVFVIVKRLRYWFEYNLYNNWFVDFAEKKDENTILRNLGPIIQGCVWSLILIIMISAWTYCLCCRKKAKMSAEERDQLQKEKWENKTNRFWKKEKWYFVTKIVKNSFFAQFGIFSKKCIAHISQVIL